MSAYCGRSLKGGEILSRDTILKIKEAEAQADKIRSAAQAEAKARIKAAEERGKKLCADTEVSASAENEEKLVLIRARADEMINSNKESSREESKALTDEAALHLREAVRYIIGGVMEECQ